MVEWLARMRNEGWYEREGVRAYKRAGVWARERYPPYGPLMSGLHTVFDGASPWAPFDHAATVREIVRLAAKDSFF